MLFICCMTLLAIPIGVIWGVVCIIRDAIEERKFRERYGIR